MNTVKDIQPRMTSRRKQAEETREKLLQVSLDLIREKGYDHVKIEDICTQAHTSVGAFYHHFKNKAGIVVALYSKVDRHFLTDVIPAILGGHGVVPHMNQYMLEDLMTFHHVEIHTSTVIDNTYADHVTVKSGDKTWDVPCNTLVTCVGYRANNALYTELANESMVPVHNIGDSNKVRNIMAAIWDAYELGRSI